MDYQPALGDSRGGQMPPVAASPFRNGGSLRQQRGRMLAVEAPASAPPWAEVITAAERPDLWLALLAEDRFRSVWHNHHGNHAGRDFGVLFPDHADLQVLVVDTPTRTPDTCRSGTPDIAARHDGLTPPAGTLYRHLPGAP